MTRLLSRSPTFQALDNRVGALELGGSRVLNALNYGAAANGVDDDADTLLQALAKLSGSGGRLYLPAGYYKITKALWAAFSNIIIEGDGRGATVLQPYGWIDAVRFANGYPGPAGVISNVGILNLTIDCGNQTAGTDDTNGNGINFNDCDNFLCQNVEILSVKQQGVAITYFPVSGSVPKGGEVRNCFVDLGSSNNIGIGAEGNARKIAFCGNHIENVGSSVALYSGNVGSSGAAGDVIISDNFVLGRAGNVGRGVTIEDGARRVIVSANIITSMSQGIRAAVVGGTNNSYNFVISSNIVTDFSQYGIGVGPQVPGDYAQALCVGNTVVTTNVTATEGILSFGGATITANLVDYGGSACGIAVTGSSTNISGNTVRGTAGFAIDVSMATNSAVFGNYCNRDISNPADPVAANIQIYGNLGYSTQRWYTGYIGVNKSVPNPNGNSAPTSGTWAQDDKVWNNSVSSGGYIGYVCTASGTPGTWKAFGLIA
jgi:hypothetical protein